MKAALLPMFVQFRQLQRELTPNRQIRARSERAVRKIEAGAIPPKGGAQWDIAASAVSPV